MMFDSEEKPANAIVVQEDFSKDGIQMDFTSTNYGCKHYRRRCKIRAPCCDEIFDCRHCHNEAKNGIDMNPLDRHDVPRHEVKRVICSLCGTEQDVQQDCVSCGVCMGNYFCNKCKFFDDDVSKKRYHCNDCGICRNGAAENFFHCRKCGCCYASTLKDAHHCIERAMHHNCAVCFEFLFDSMKNITVLPCGHTLHLTCIQEMRSTTSLLYHRRYSCPVCYKSICDMSNLWRKLDEEIALKPMPEMFKNKMVWILCNDCEEKCEVQFHNLAYKCLGCKSYNTQQIQGSPASC